jgi:type IV pilus assembly protein PilW
MTTHGCFRSPHRASGLSLIELMVALALGAFLILGLVQLFSASRSTFLASEGLSRVQETGRTAMDWMQRDLRMAGHMGCVSDQAVFLGSAPRFQNLLEQLAAVGPPAVAAVPPPFFYRVGSGVQGFEATGTGVNDIVDRSVVENPAGTAAVASWTPSLPADLSPILAAGVGQAVEGSDVVVVRYFSAESLPVELVVPGVPSVVRLPAGTAAAANPDFLEPGAIYGLNDCIQAAVFQLTSVAGDELTVAQSGLNVRTFDGTAQFAQGSMLYRVESVVYYVGVGASGQPALFRWFATPNGANVNAQREELLDGVEMLQAQYGLDTTAALSLPDGTVDTMRVAAPINQDNQVILGMQVRGQWLRAGTVRIGVLVRSPQGAQSQAPEDDYVVNGTTVTTFADGRVRQVYESTVAMRNRLFGN